ncbi:site-specific integrase [[Eubacterium] hominis]|uniref:site-specific integrase n=1 Tax=[Eubacterium] hominis TaxID=2764325 RepID=UPI0022E07B5D
MRSNNYVDPKTGKKFYRAKVDGVYKYSIRFRDINSGDAKSKWSPLLDSPKKVLEYVTVQRNKNAEFSLKQKSPKKHTYKEVFDACITQMRIDYKLEERSPSTIGKYRRINCQYVFGDDKHKIPYDNIGNKYVEDMVIQDIKQLKNNINNTYSGKLCKSTIGKIFTHIDRTFKYARDMGYVTNTFYNEIYVTPRGRKQASKQAVRNFFSENEYMLFREKYDEYYIKYFSTHIKQRNRTKKYSNDLYIQFKYHLFKCYFSLAFYAGARKSENRGAKWSDIIYPTEDFILGMIKLDSQFSEADAKELDLDSYERKPKSDSSVRICTMHQQLFADLMDYKAFLIDNGLFDENQFISFDIFTRTPKPIPRTNLDRTYNHFKDLTKIEENSPIINGIKRNITIHGLRHSACAMLLEKGMSIEDVAKFLGHKDTKMVEYVYHHFVNPVDMEKEKLKRNMQYFMM